MDARRPEMVEAVRATDFLLGRDEWGATWIRMLPREAGGSDRVSALEAIPEERHPDRVRLRFLQSGEDRAVKEARVLAGTTIFDAASWNGVAIDSTCGGHGTCKKCKVQGRLRARADQSGRPARVHHRGAEGRLAARVPREHPGGSHDRGAAAADPAEGRARRCRTARDSAARRAEALRRARRADARGPAVRPRAPARGDGRPRAARAARHRARARRHAARARTGR